jgi:hypothetical protein
LLVVAADLTIYRGHGFAGFAAFLLAAPLLLVTGAIQPRGGWRTWLLSGLLVLLAARMLWCGWELQVLVGVALLIALAMVLTGQIPRVIEGIGFAITTPPAGLVRGLQYARWLGDWGRPLARFHWLALVLPVLALVIFGALFVLANPDLLAAISENWTRAWTVVQDWLLTHGPQPAEVLFWIIVAGLSAGLLRPIFGDPAHAAANNAARAIEPVESKPTPAQDYRPYRNTLLAVIVLFAVYLVYEFITLWFREFPPGFHYSGYAHEGAAWLTVALAVATLVLSTIFRGSILVDARLPRLRRLAWLWSAENLLLAVAVYHRLHIYMGFNGLTRMRMVGIFGITAVVIGLLLVVYKIHRGRNFLWLVRGQLTALATIVFLFAITPVDWIVSTYNVRRIMGGDPAPSVQISVHPIRSEGIPSLMPLLRCDDPIIRDGIAALLAQRHAEAESRASRNQSLGWTTYQIADQRMLETLREHRARWLQFTDAARRRDALDRFHKYAYQWY